MEIKLLLLLLRTLRGSLSTYDGDADFFLFYGRQDALRALPPGRPGGRAETFCCVGFFTGLCCDRSTDDPGVPVLLQARAFVQAPDAARSAGVPDFEQTWHGAAARGFCCRPSSCFAGLHHRRCRHDARSKITTGPSLAHAVELKRHRSALSFLFVSVVGYCGHLNISIITSPSEIDGTAKAPAFRRRKATEHLFRTRGLFLSCSGTKNIHCCSRRVGIMAR